MVRLSKSDKNILQVIDILLYCKDQYDGWDVCEVDSTCRSRNREWLLYRQLYLNLKQQFYEAARRASSDPLFSSCTNCKIGNDILHGISSMIVDTATYTPFVPPNQCNQHCPGGTYDPYDRDSISYYVEYGNPGISPSGTPLGYNNCHFYTVFDVKTASTSSCKFYNVWVCIKDSTCPAGNCSGSGGYSSQCPDDPEASLYENKQRRYPEYINTTDFINSGLSANPSQNSDQNTGAILNECHDFCEAQAEYWINTLNKCTTDSAKLADLKTALIATCAASCSVQNPMGASTVDTAVATTYHSFEEAIIAIIGPGAINDSCTQELLASPYPYNRQPVYEQPVIMETNYDICQKVLQFQTAYQAAGFTGSFHQYMQHYYGDGYGLDSLELDDMINSCTKCNNLLQNDINLPVVFDPASRPCLLCDSAQAAKTAFALKFPGIDSSSINYEILYSNYFNHRFGYSLTYGEYQNFIDSCSAHSNLYAFKLCNKATVQSDTLDDFQCTTALFNLALTNAYGIYTAYIDSVRLDFRDAWTTKCLNVQPRLSMRANLYEYHYTLYYYDQSGNLVKTVPPEGVSLLDNAGLADVNRYRMLKSEGCYQNSDSIHMNNDGYVNWTIASTFQQQPYTIETMVNLDSHDDQVIMSQVSEGVDHDHDDRIVYLGFVFNVESGKLAFHIYGLDDTLGPLEVHVQSTRDIANLLPTGKWAHLAVERSFDSTNPVKIFINGQQIAIDYIANTIFKATLLEGGTGFVSGAASYESPDIGFPGKLTGTLKNLRIYSRLLQASELRQNAFNVCQLPSSQPGLIFWAPMNDATDNSIKDLMSGIQGVLTGIEWTPFTGVFPEHKLATTYHYNSLNQVVQQFSPDGDTSVFYYDRLGRLTISQNKEQKENTSYSGSANRFSYTGYDPLGRITEVGEKSDPSDDIRNIDMLDTTAVKGWLATGTNRQITRTIYDDPIDLFQSAATSRKRVVASIYLENADDTEGDSTLYDYDINGNVKTLVQHIKQLVAVDATNGRKRIDYDYDLASGKVNEVIYQPGKGDQFYYKYLYDADNRIIRSYTSRDHLLWQEDASYSYYLHGPLARMELGQYKVQGVDYAYTLQGWLKGINSSMLDSTKDISRDSYYNSPFARVSRDVYGFSLGYFNKDYTAIGGSGANAFELVYTRPTVSQTVSGNGLYNGNISTTTLALSKIGNGKTTGYSYLYDQLNRLKEMDQHTISGTTWSNSTIIDAYKEQISYDANGNIQTYKRNGADAGGNPLDMDDMTYRYLPNTNKLDHVNDAVSSSNYTSDIDDQDTLNYQYDRIGNLIRDEQEKLDTVRWTVYGKIKRIVKAAGATIIQYSYDAGGNRTVKTVSGAADTSTYYVRDATGNTMAVYSKKGSDGPEWNEQDLYGSSRLGMWRWDTVVPATPPTAPDEGELYDSILTGSRTYELTNHLGNVLATISDKKIGNDSIGTANYYLAEVLSQNDYYPGGMDMSGRQYNTTTDYRYGFNGKEKDKEGPIQYDYGFRIYDPRLVRFKSVDPLMNSYPELTPYQYGSNNGVWNIDLDGLEGVPYTDPKQILYQAGADLSQALGRAWDKVTGFFVSFKNSDDVELTKSKSLVTTSETSVDVGGNMESWIRGGRYSLNNRMPKLHVSNFFDVKVKTENKVELKTKVEAGNVKVENKINLVDGSQEIKTTFKIPANQVTKVPLKASVIMGQNNTTNTTKISMEVKSDTKPFAVGGSIELTKDNTGNVNGKAGVSLSAEQKVDKVTHTSTLTVGKKF